MGLIYLGENAEISSVEGISFVINETTYRSFISSKGFNVLWGKAVTILQKFQTWHKINFKITWLWSLQYSYLLYLAVFNLVSGYRFNMTRGIMKILFAPDIYLVKKGHSVCWLATIYFVWMWSSYNVHIQHTWGDIHCLWFYAPCAKLAKVLFRLILNKLAFQLIVFPVFCAV